MSDIYDVKGDRRYTKVYKAHTPDILERFGEFDAAVFAPEGRAVPLKYRELAAVAVALTTQCVYCIDHHVTAAQQAGATEAELAEIAWVATALRAGAAYTHGRLAFKLGGVDGTAGHAAPGGHEH